MADLKQYKVTKNRFVEDTIAQQFDYYADKQDLKLAERWEEAVLVAFASLRKLPNRGANGHFHRKRLNGLRWIAVPTFPFRMFYFVDESARWVKVVHMLHDGRSIEKILIKASLRF